MGKKNNKKQLEKKSSEVKISKRFKASINTFEAKAYCHLNDSNKKKYISFDLETAVRIAKRMPKIISKMRLEQDKVSEASATESETDFSE